MNKSKKKLLDRDQYLYDSHMDNLQKKLDLEIADAAERRRLIEISFLEAFADTSIEMPDYSGGVDKIFF